MSTWSDAMSSGTFRLERRKAPLRCPWWGDRTDIYIYIYGKHNTDTCVMITTQCNITYKTQTPNSVSVCSQERTATDPNCFKPLSAESPAVTLLLRRCAHRSQGLGHWVSSLSFLLPPAFSPTATVLSCSATAASNTFQVASEPVLFDGISGSATGPVRSNSICCGEVRMFLEGSDETPGGFGTESGLTRWFLLARRS